MTPDLAWTCVHMHALRCVNINTKKARLRLHRRIGCAGNGRSLLHVRLPAFGNPNSSGHDVADLKAEVMAARGSVCTKRKRENIVSDVWAALVSEQNSTHGR